MTFVVDAGVLLAVYLDEPASGSARAALAGERLTAPQLIFAEVANAAWKAHRTGRIARQDALTFLARTREYFGEPAPFEVLAPAALDLAIRRDHPAYDCFYVALAMREGAPLLTTDRCLAERFAGDADIQLIGPDQPSSA